jgi:glucose/arabinose dehydrogenase
MPVTRESMLTDLKQRIRDIRQGPDGLIYLLTDENHGAILKLEPLSPVAPVSKDEKAPAAAPVR